MDRKKTNATASATAGKQAEKKEENFFSKTAHSIRDKVHEFTDDVKEKTHNLTHSSESKKNKKENIQKPTGAASKSSPNPRTVSAKGPNSSSDDDDDTTKPASSPSAPAAKRGDERNTSKPDTSGSKPAAAASTSLKPPSDKPVLTSKSSDEHKNTGASSSANSSPRNSAVKPPGSSSTNDAKTSTDKPDKTENNNDAKNESPATANNKDRVHIKFDGSGVSTVDDLLDRIDDAIERAKIIVENSPNAINLNTRGTASVPAPSVADLEKKSIHEVRKKENKEAEEEEGDNNDEPIRIDFNEIHILEDILFKINNQPGHRKVILENAPNNSGSITVLKQLNPSSDAPLTSENPVASNDEPSSSSTDPTENDDQSASTKSILKTSHDPSSLDTSTKTSTFEDEQIHVNIEGGQVVNNLLDRIIDDAVHIVPTIIESEPSSEKQHAPQAPERSELAPRLSQKRQAPKAPCTTNDHGENVPSITVSQFSDSGKPTDQEGKDNPKDASDWM